jgi:hypothetical protein
LQWFTTVIRQIAAVPANGDRKKRKRKPSIKFNMGKAVMAEIGILLILRLEIPSLKQKAAGKTCRFLRSSSRFVLCFGSSSQLREIFYFSKER